MPDIYGLTIRPVGAWLFSISEGSKFLGNLLEAASGFNALRLCDNASVEKVTLTEALKFVATPCSGTPRQSVNVQGEGNSVIVSGDNLTVLHAGRHIIFGKEKKP